MKKRVRPKTNTQETTSLEPPPRISNNAESIPAVLGRFSIRTQLSLNLRYRTRDRCLADFRAKGMNEVMALAKDLHAFLASWGFSERTALILPSDSRLLTPIVEIILDPIFIPLRDSGARELLDPHVQRLVLLSATRIAKAYRESIAMNIDNSDELVTHIIAATFGSIPPFENSLRKGMRTLGLAPDSFSIGAMRTLAEFYLKHEEEFEKFRKDLSDRKSNYTQMAVLGFYLCELGNENLGTKTIIRKIQLFPDPYQKYIFLYS